jgi:divalent metal cation (Fe/Co/Zn/Cd) transporter
MVEDSAALLCIVIAGLEIFRVDITGSSIFDGIDSFATGTILMAFAFFLALEDRGLLVGESISKNEYRKISELIKTIPEVNHLVSTRTMHLGAEDVIIGIEVNLVE